MAATSVKKMEKTLEAETVALLKHMLETELKRLCKEGNIDIVLFMGIDGRIFASNIPPNLSAPQFHLLNLIKSNLPYLCGQLRSENLQVSVQQYKEGTIIISGVGENAFLASLLTSKVDITKVESLIKAILKASTVLNHIFELRPITERTLARYPEDVAQELKKLSRLLFVERFEQTREYKRNMEIYNFIKKKLEPIVGIGALEEVLTLTFNELGTSAPYMNDKLWLMFTDKVIKDHIKQLRGDMTADECYKTWIPELEKKLKSFL